MICGRLKQVITMEIYDEKGQFTGKRAKYIYTPILLWRDVIIGLSLAFTIIHTIYMR